MFVFVVRIFFLRVQHIAIFRPISEVDRCRGVTVSRDLFVGVQIDRFLSYIVPTIHIIHYTYYAYYEHAVCTYTLTS